jgi:hypothetical protein
MNFHEHLRLAPQAGAAVAAMDNDVLPNALRFEGSGTLWAIHTRYFILDSS